MPEQHSGVRRASLRGPRLMRGTAAIALALGTALPAFADSVTDALHRAETSYQRKDFAAALSALTTAGTLIRQMKAEAWKSVLPDPPPGWTADDANVLTVGPALLGGGSSTERRYRHPGGTVTISLIADSPALQSVAVLLDAGLLVSGSDIMVIEGQRVAYDADDNTLQAIVGDKVLVKVQGSPGVDKQTLESFFGAIKLQEIEKTL